MVSAPACDAARLLLAAQNPAALNVTSSRNEAFPPSGEVRRCACCGQVALVVVHAWQHKYAGLYTGAQTLDLECKSCGIKVVLHPQTTIRAERIIAFLLMPAIIPGLIFYLGARKKARAWTDNPVVEGAAPRDDQPSGPPARRCDCSGAAVCVAIVRKGAPIRPIGTQYDYRCARCAKTFKVHDVPGTLFASLLALVLFAAGALVILHPPGSAVGAEESNRWFGYGMVVLGVIASLVFAARVRGRLAHPVVSI